MSDAMLHNDMLPLFCHDSDSMSLGKTVFTHTPSTPIRAARHAPAERADTAAARFHSMGCAQALATAYADLAGLSELEAANLASGFDHGMGRQLTCGAVTAMLMLAGLAGKGDLCNELIEEFETQTGSSSCDYFLERHQGQSQCPQLIRRAAGILNRHVFPGDPKAARELVELA